MVTIPGPEPGLVISYSYLWHREHQAGADEGRKDRPAVIILVSEGRARELVVTVVPITHSRPADERAGVEIPMSVKRHIGLDDAPSWVIVAEGNQFVWPGYDLRPRTDGRYAYGFLPPRLFDRIRESFIAYKGVAKTLVPRD